MLYWNVEGDEKIPKIDLKKSDPNNDGKLFFFPNSDGKNFYHINIAQLFFDPNSDGKLFFDPNNDGISFFHPNYNISHFSP